MWKHYPGYGATIPPTQSRSRKANRVVLVFLFVDMYSRFEAVCMRHMRVFLPLLILRFPRMVSTFADLAVADQEMTQTKCRRRSFLNVASVTSAKKKTFGFVKWRFFIRIIGLTSKSNLSRTPGCGCNPKTAENWQSWDLMCAGRIIDGKKMSRRAWVTVAPIDLWYLLRGKSDESTGFGLVWIPFLKSRFQLPNCYKYHHALRGT